MARKTQKQKKTQKIIKERRSKEEWLLMVICFGMLILNLTCMFKISHLAIDSGIRLGLMCVFAGNSIFYGLASRKLIRGIFDFFAKGG